jgi:hypothetical protein
MNISIYELAHDFIGEKEQAGEFDEEQRNESDMESDLVPDNKENLAEVAEEWTRKH